jgi:hypothetical protein
MIQKLRGRPGHPYLSEKIPAGAQTPVAKLNLRPGELVRVKDQDAILGTVDANSRNRGLVWNAEMVPYCGGEYRVRRRVNRIIDEKTGREAWLEHGTATPLTCPVTCPKTKMSESRHITALAPEAQR